MSTPSPNSAKPSDLSALQLTPSEILRLVDLLSDGIAIFDSAWRIAYANSSARRISQMKDDFILGDTLWNLYPGLSETAAGKAYLNVMITRQEQTLTGFYYAPLDTVFDIRVIPLESGIAIHYSDVTHETQQEKEIRDSAERYRVLTELSPQSLWTADAEGRVLYANQRFLTYIGHDFVPKTGDEYIACFDPEDRARVIEVWTHSVVTGHDYAIDARLLRASDGASRWWHLRALPVRDPEGNITQWLGSASDIHDERLVQQQLLEQIAQQKRAEAALIQSEKLAAVGRMASSIAHEINNPLESVTNLLFLARQCAVNPDAQQFLDLADQELRRVSSIANQTLRFHKQASNPRQISPIDLLSTVLSMYEGRLRNSQVRVDLSRLGGNPISCFEGDIRQVLNNLVGNAIDAMPTGGHLLLRGRDATDWKTSRRGLRITVADTGSGIDPAALARIFDAFYTTKGISGTGLGLWISAEIMERHQGHLRVRSSQNPEHHGTVFSLFLPCDAIPTTA